MEDTMLNWWLLVFLVLGALTQGIQLGSAKDRYDFWGIAIGILFYWGLLYMADVFTLL